MARFGYSINLDERGEFEANVRNEHGQTIYQISGPEPFEDGVMVYKDDLIGLTDHLRSLGLLKVDDVVVRLVEMERACEAMDRTGIDAGDIDDVFDAAIAHAEEHDSRSTEFEIEHTRFGWAVKQFDADGEREFSRYYVNQQAAKLAVIEWVEKNLQFDRECACAPSP